MKYFQILIIIFFSFYSEAQKKILDHSDFEIWNRIQNPKISAYGNFIMYSIQTGEKDSQLKIKDKTGKLIFEYNRSEEGVFTHNSKFAVFKIKAWRDSITEMKRRKVKKDKMPIDTLGIFSLNRFTLKKINNVKSYKIPEKWDGYIAYTFEKKTSDNLKNKTDVDNDKTNSIIKTKKSSSKNGYPLVIHNLNNSAEDTIPFVTSYTFSKKSNVLAYITTGIKDSIDPGVYIKNLKSNLTQNVYKSHDKAKYYKLSLSDSGKNLAFIVDTDSTKSYQESNELYNWSFPNQKAKLIVNKTTSPDGYGVSSDGTLNFSNDESKLYFGLALPKIVQDTLLIEEEIVNVEVWTYNEPRLYTIQEKQLNNDKKKSFKTVYHLKKNKLVQIASKEFPDAILTEDGDENYALISRIEPYQLSSQWTAQFSKNDLAIININDGVKKLAIKGNPSSASLSPFGKYAFGYNQVDSTWYTYNIKDSKYIELTKGKVFYNELSDYPNHPRSYGFAGWTKNDKSILIYDRYDIWEFNPDNGKGTRLTKGRETQTVYRNIKLERDKKYIEKSDQMLFTTFDENNKNSGYYKYNYKEENGFNLINGPYRYSTPVKARENNYLMYTKQSFELYPDIRFSDLSFKSEKLISDVNPQQSEYNWGTAELINWSSLDGLPLTGMLIKPENFDPNKKYPMIVNFYEKSSDGLHTHRAPNPGRSSINYSFYTSRGYVIFNPDVYYRVGYPGESAFNCVIPGVTSLIEKGFIDKDNIGVQGHSWGGYQIAYLVTKTDIFKAAESGAPVVNMVSAYGGIRWDTGLSRQFQYEHTQSRLGGTPWEYPQRYFENSPIYNIDKINTPLLIMHNDADGHVPWYQGIEFFVSLRRLSKPSWLLNYNGARHWPLKMQNRKDFNIRMQQFFDHYLKGDPKPVWMVKGVPAIEKGINQGYELIDN